MVIAWHADDSGLAWPGIKTISAETGLSERQAWACIARLKADRELLIIESGGGVGQGKGRSNRYQIALFNPEVPNTDSALTENPNTDNSGDLTLKDSVSKEPLTLKDSVFNPVGDFTRTKIEPSEKNNHQKKPTFTAEFNQTFSKYPPRPGDSKKAANRAYNARIREGVLPADIDAGVERYRAYCDAEKITGTKYVKQAVTFFGPDEFWTADWTPTQPQVNGHPASANPVFEMIQRSVARR
jgi:hypothetical protein